MAKSRIKAKGQNRAKRDNSTVAAGSEIDAPQSRPNLPAKSNIPAMLAAQWRDHANRLRPDSSTPRDNKLRIATAIWRAFPEHANSLAAEIAGIARSTAQDILGKLYTAAVDFLASAAITEGINPGPIFEAATTSRELFGGEPGYRPGMYGDWPACLQTTRHHLTRNERRAIARAEGIVGRLESKAVQLDPRQNEQDDKTHQHDPPKQKDKLPPAARRNKGGSPAKWSDLLELWNNKKPEEKAKDIVSKYNQRYGAPIKAGKRQKATVEKLQNAIKYRNRRQKN